MGTFTEIFTRNSIDARIVDNGDGTLTIEVRAAGSSRYYDTDGSFVPADRVWTGSGSVRRRRAE